MNLRTLEIAGSCGAGDHVVDEEGDLVIGEVFDGFGDDVAERVGFEEFGCGDFFGEVDIAFCGGDVRMSEVFLQDEQVTAIGLEPCCEVVSEAVGVDPMGDVFTAGALGGALDQEVDGPRLESFVVVLAISEEGIVARGFVAAQAIEPFHVPQAKVPGDDVFFHVGSAKVYFALFETGLDAFDAHGPDANGFALMFDLAGEDGAAIERHEFGDADAGGGEEGNQRGIAGMDGILFILLGDDFTEVFRVQDAGIGDAGADVSDQV